MKVLSKALALIMVASLVLAACGAAPTATPPPAPTAAPAATKAPAAPTAAPAATQPAPTATRIPTPTLIAGAPTAVITGGGPGSPVDNVSLTAPVELTFWHTSTQLQEQILLNFVNEFNSTHPNIKVKPEFGGSYSDIRKKILAAITAKQTPDLSIAYQNTVAEYAGAGVIAPLDDYINSAKYGFSKDDLADFFPGFLSSEKYPTQGNKYMSFAFLRSLEVMFYNIDVLKAAGQSGEPPQTWDDFEKACKAALTVSGKKGYAINISASTITWQIWSRGGEVISADGKKATFNNQAGIDAMTYIKSLVDSGCAYQIAERYGDQTDFANNKIMFTFGSTAGIPYYAQAINDKTTGKPTFQWSVAAPPHAAGQPIVIDQYGPSVTVFKSTPEKQLAAWIFIKWFTEAQQTARWAVQTGYLPVRKSAANSDVVKQAFDKDPNYKKAFDLLQYAKGEPTVPAWEAVRTTMQDAEVAVITGKMTPKQALDDAVNKANDALAQ